MPFQSLLSFDSPRNILIMEVTLKEKNAVLIHFSPNQFSGPKITKLREYSEYIFPIISFMTLG